MRKKKLLIDINHPAHVHLFKHVIAELTASGHGITVAAKDVRSITDLLTAYNIPFVRVGTKKDGLIWKYIVEFFHVVRVWWLVVSRQIDYGIGVSMVLPVVSMMTRMKSFCLDDDDMVVTPVFGRFVSRADAVLTPSALAYENRGPNQVCHDSFHELAYLHPNRFVPDPTILNVVGVLPDEPFFILRFNAFKAHHDEGAQGLSLVQKRALIDLLKPHGKLFITTERDIEPELKAYQMPVAPQQIHSLMYYATMFIGDSQTMTSEAGLLGTPAIKLNSFAGRLSIPNELEERHKLCYSFLPSQFDRMLLTIETLLETPDLKAEWGRRRDRMLTEKVDLTSFLAEFITRYPHQPSPTKQKTVAAPNA